MRQGRRTCHHAERQSEEFPAFHTGVLARRIVWRNQRLQACKALACGCANGKHRLKLGNPVDRITIAEVRNDTKALDVGHPDHWYKIGDDQHDILCDLSPGDGAHPAQHRADQNAQQTKPDAKFERNAQGARCDCAGRVDLCGHIGEGRNRQNDHCTKPRQVAAVACANEVRNRVAAEFAQIRSHQRIHQYIAASPADDESQITVTTEVDAACKCDEGSAGHPIGCGCHAIENRWHLPARQIIGVNLRGAADPADCRVDQDRKDYEADADGLRVNAQLLQHRHDGDED